MRMRDSSLSTQVGTSIWTLSRLVRTPQELVKTMEADRARSRCCCGCRLRALEQLPHAAVLLRHLSDSTRQAILQARAMCKKT